MKEHNTSTIAKEFNIHPNTVRFYEEIKNILGFEIDHSFLNYKKELKEYGYEVGKISMKEKTIIFNKI